MRKLKILLIEDNVALVESLKEFVEQIGHEVAIAETGTKGLKYLETDEYNLALLDLNLPELDGIQILEKLQDMNITTPIIVMTGYHSVESAVKAMKLGAVDYLKKPLDVVELKLIIERVLERFKMEREINVLQTRLGIKDSSQEFIGSSPAMKDVLRLVEKVAENDQTTILLTGESGTGKNVIAHMIHKNSPRSEQPFINVTCSAISDQLLESELMGHKRGSFTDAVADKIGLFELANRGTIFLDEIGDMSFHLQAKILRVLDEKTFRPVGGLNDITVDVRVITATNKNLAALVEKGEFREDLYYRMNVINIEIPPLRDREKDIPLLVQSFIRKFKRELGRDIKKCTPQALRVLEEYHWPGNLRELRNVIERAILLSESDILGLKDISSYIRQKEKPGKALEKLTLPDGGVDLEKLEKDILLQAMEKCGGNVSRAARFLTIGRDKMRYRLKKYGIEA